MSVTKARDTIRYIYVWEGEKMIHDYLQDTLEIAKRFAQEKFNVPADAWKEAS